MSTDNLRVATSRSGEAGDGLYDSIWGPQARSLFRIGLTPKAIPHQTALTDTQHSVLAVSDEVRTTTLQLQYD